MQSLPKGNICSILHISKGETNFQQDPNEALPAMHVLRRCVCSGVVYVIT